jgi:hypothetical protein
MARSGINKQEIARMMREIEREFNKYTIKVPVEVEQLKLPKGFSTGGTTIYNGPVIHGNANGAQLAWSNSTVHQTQARTEQIAPGFEAIAQAVVSTLKGLPTAGLPDEDLHDAEAVVEEALAEITQPEPDRGKLRRAVAALKGLLAPIAAGLASGGAQGTAQEWAKTAIEQLGVSF